MTSKFVKTDPETTGSVNNTLSPRANGQAMPGEWLQMADKLVQYGYAITGSVEEARDIVQDVLLRLAEKKDSTIQYPNTYLARAVINRAINRKKQMRRMLPQYPGAWLPEPLAPEAPDAALDQADMLSYSIMVLLEKLPPRQRAIFILKEAFDYDHREIAGLFNITPENSRKLLSRAHAALKQTSPVPKPQVSPFAADRYLKAIQQRDLKALEKLLSEDIVVTSDGGGKARAALHPVFGRNKAARLLLGLGQKFYSGAQSRWVTINRQPALLWYQNRKLTNCQIFTLRNGAVTEVFLIRNPDKLKNIA